VRWYANLTYDELKDILNVDNSYEIIRILNQAQKINVDKTNIKSGIIKHCEFFIKGIPFEEKRVELAKKIEVGDTLEIIREYDNIYDAYAIKINFEGEQIGYVPRELSRKLALEIDLYGIKYLGKVASKKVIRGNYVILVEATKVDNV
jgi:helicase